MTYRSKIGPEIVIPIGIVLGGIATLFAAQGIWQGLIIIGSVALFIVHMFVTTRYTVKNTMLHIVCGFLYSNMVDIRNIKSIRSTNNLISSPAASLDRMELVLRSGERIIVSPKDKKEFLLHLRRINAGIDIAVQGVDT
ncbi:MAG: PH domain-containing protein [Bacteroidota bacterium]